MIVAITRVRASKMATKKNSKKTDKKTQKSNEKAKKDFQWTDDEAELLLSVTYDYKTAKAVDGVDWESIKSKYEDILERFRAELPDQPPSTAEKERINCGLAKSLVHTKEDVTKQILTTKLKNIRQKYRQAVDSGRRSGHGRVVLLYYELCEKVWGGSPATEQLETGLESTDLMVSCDSEATPPTSNTSTTNSTDYDDPSGSGNLSSSDDDDDDDGSDSKHKNATTPVISPSTIKSRRQSLDKKLGEYKQEKLKRKLPVDAQLLDCAQEDIKIKRRLVEQMDNMDKQYAESVQSISKNVEKLTESISEGFSFLRMMFVTPPPSMYANGPVPSCPPYSTMYPAASNRFQSGLPPSRSGPSSSSWNSTQEEWGFDE